MRANACERAQHLAGYHLAHDGRHERGGAQVRPLAALRTLAHGHRHGLLARVQHAQAADAAFARLLAHDSAQRAVHRVEHVGEPESFGAQLVGRPHAADEAHAAHVEPIEGDWYVTFDHEMNKQHHLGFVAVVGFDRMAVEKLYPEQGAEARLPRLGGAKPYTYCTAHGLLRHEPARR